MVVCEYLCVSTGIALLVMGMYADWWFWRILLQYITRMGGIMPRGLIPTGVIREVCDGICDNDERHVWVVEVL